MELFLNIIYFFAGLAALYYGADFLVKGGVDIAKRLGISSLVIGLTLVAFATSSPELVVSVSAALDGSADISLGNIVGSNICNIVLILGLCAVITPLQVQRQLLRFDAPIMVTATILFSVFYFISDGLTRWQGAILFLGVIIYTAWSIIYSRKEQLNSPEGCEIPASNDEIQSATESDKKMSAWLALILI